MTDPSTVPFPVEALYRMRPGLRRYEGTLTSRDSGFAAAQSCVMRAVGERWLPLGEWQTAGFSDALDEADELIGSQAAPCAASNQSFKSRDQLPNRLLGLRRDIQEDIVFMAPDSGGRVVGLAVAMPSGWDPAQKLGMSFAGIHRVVPDAVALTSSAGQLVRLIMTDGPFRRYVWTLVGNPHLSQHPDQRRLATTGSQVWFRVEQQTTVPLPRSRYGLFLIRVFQAPLAEILAVEPGRAECLAASLRSMSDAIIEYKNLSVLRDIAISRYCQDNCRR